MPKIITEGTGMRILLAAGGVPDGANIPQAQYMRDSTGVKIAEALENGGGGGEVIVTGSTPTITAEANTRYLCGEVSTISFTPSDSGISDVIFTSGTTAAVLTIPETVKFPAGVDLTSLETSTIYEINVLDGVYGVVATWPLS